jgi:hypothetical protein
MSRMYEFARRMRWPFAMRLLGPKAGLTGWEVMADIEVRCFDR